MPLDLPSTLSPFETSWIRHWKARGAPLHVCKWIHPAQGIYMWGGDTWLFCLAISQSSIKLNTAGIISKYCVLPPSTPRLTDSHTLTGIPVDRGLFRLKHSWLRPLRISYVGIFNKQFSRPRYPVVRYKVTTEPIGLYLSVPGDCLGQKWWLQSSRGGKKGAGKISGGGVWVSRMVVASRIVSFELFVERIPYSRSSLVHWLSNRLCLATCHHSNWCTNHYGRARSLQQEGSLGRVIN